MKDYLLTYEDAQEIVKYYKNFHFSEHQHMINGYKVSAFDYFICGYNDFANPLPHNPSINAFDMRGTTFVFNKDGSLWRKYMMLPKFFNLNQVETTQYLNVKDKKISHISAKEDGSLVTFMMTPDGKLFAKTIRGFTNDQSVGAYNLLYEWEDHVIWVKNLLNSGLTPLFEYVSWDNRIVLKYSKAELRFIGARDNHNGRFFPASKMNQYYIPKTMYSIPEEYSTLDELIERAKTEENIEGWVVMFEDGMMIKIKTAWYFNIHGIRTDHIFREDYIIKNYYQETLDDVVSQLDPEEDKDALDFVDMVTGAINNYSANIDVLVGGLYNLWTEYKNTGGEEAWGDFATKYHKEAYFGFVKIWDNPIEYKKRKIELILARTYRLKSAQFIVDRWKEKDRKYS